jgi:hypothetical protein
VNSDGLADLSLATVVSPTTAYQARWLRGSSSDWSPLSKRHAVPWPLRGNLVVAATVNRRSRTRKSTTSARACGGRLLRRSECVVPLNNYTRTQNGHIRNDTRVASRMFRGRTAPFQGKQGRG